VIDELSVYIAVGRLS